MAKAKKDGRPTTLREGRERCAKTIKKNLGRAKFSPSLTRYTLRDAHAESDKNYGQESDPLFSLSFIVRSLLILLSGLEWSGSGGFFTLGNATYYFRNPWEKVTPLTSSY